MTSFLGQAKLYSKMMKLFLILNFLITYSFAGTDCETFKSKGCVYVPPEIKSSEVLVFIRGLYQGKSEVALKKKSKVALETMNDPQFQLKALSEKTGMILFVSGSSKEIFGLNEFKILGKKLNKNIYGITFAAHSGGYAGLNSSLLTFKENSSLIKRIFMLDNFYSEKEGGLKDTLRGFYNSGVKCQGFMTYHNLKNQRKYYSFCEVIGPENFSHSGSVGPYLFSEFKSSFE